ncbi:LDH2 family malate/lactate/ureidoglycolate dehydrogenase [Paenarthrobacter nicotinovorans]|uniref:Ldh family oxidoreductase n=1 Tax=Paenarthrobacter nicotinovorans TaxID=29320 RepID=UPI00277F88EC|nr:Ldh family oxidoreductase [Paenarthrobacter nicotinovorans]MDP9933814.1 LDH2 family malate/lactate/ureidoglycolate dehydrogenase [Paenarthrobacter nicotinovorans]
MKTNAKGSASPSIVVPRDDLRKVISDALRANGASKTNAEIQAENLVEGELRGHASHGIRRLAVLVERMRRGLIMAGAEPHLEWVASSVLRVDGNRGFGPVVARMAIDEVLARANETGIAMAAISNSSHIGMLAPYVEYIAGRGQIAVLLTTSEALVHAWGGRGAYVGTNPIGIGVPTAGEPLVLDMSTASVSMGKILDYAATGRALQPGWAVDALGRPTTDAVAAVDGGALSPFGGPKGYALGIALEALVGTLTASAFGTDVRGTLDTEFPATKGDLLISVSLERLGLTAMLPALTAYLHEVRESGVAGPADVPGDRARRLRTQRSEDGVPLDDEVWALALKYAEGLTHD